MLTLCQSPTLPILDFPKLRRNLPYRSVAARKIWGRRFEQGITHDAWGHRHSAAPNSLAAICMSLAHACALRDLRGSNRSARRQPSRHELSPLEPRMLRQKQKQK